MSYILKNNLCTYILAIDTDKVVVDGQIEI